MFAQILALNLLIIFAQAEETLGENAKATGHKIAQKAKKATHRVKEAFCKEGELKCATEKGKHRIQEAGDELGDKAKEIKNKVD